MEQKGLTLLIVAVAIFLAFVVAIGSYLFTKSMLQSYGKKATLQTKSFQEATGSAAPLSATPSSTPRPPLFEVVGNSMLPNYKHGQVWEFESYKSDFPGRGDVALIKLINSTSLDRFGKRIIGLPGEKIKIAGGSVYINGQLLNEPYLEPEVKTSVETPGNFGNTLLKEGEDYFIPDAKYFILGDNRPSSSDSREFGPINRDLIIGKVTKCFQYCE